MRLEQILYLIEISKTGSVSVAADNLYISQPALSKAIKLLENELNTPLLERDARGVHLTEAAQYVLPTFVQISQLLNDIPIKISEYYQSQTSFTSSPISIASSPPFFNSILQPSLIRLKEHYNYMNISLSIMQSYNLENFCDETVDLFLISDINSSLTETITLSELITENIANVGFSVVVNANSEYAHKKIFSLSGTQNAQLILDQGVRLKNIISPFMEKNHHRILFESSNIHTILDGIKHFNGVYICDDITIKKFFFNTKDIVILPTKDIKGQFSALYSKNNPK